jgi:cephalosporin-C deacetylase
MSIELAAPRYGFDPSHGYSEEDLLRIVAPEPPDDFQNFWRARYDRALKVATKPTLRDTGTDVAAWRVFEISYWSTDRARVKGWLLLPRAGTVRRGFVIGHGYSGRPGPDTHLPFTDSALLFPCSRGIGRTTHGTISSDPMWHVLHDIQDRNRYVLGGCVDDLWTGVSALLRLCPYVAGHVGYLGISFSGGIGALALPWEARVQRAHLNVPTFGHQPLRLELGSTGSAASVQKFVRRHPRARETLAYFDAASAARFVRIPVHCACARFDPAVAPAGQFAIYNALAGPKSLFMLQAGHHAYPGQEETERELLQEIDNYFRDL